MLFPKDDIQQPNFRSSVAVGSVSLPLVCFVESFSVAVQLSWTITQRGQRQDSGWHGYFTMEDLETAVEEDFLDAARGSTDNRKGWQITDVSVVNRLTYEDVQNALEKGTVILNAAGAHIPKLAGPSLACTDATLLPSRQICGRFVKFAVVASVATSSK